MQKLSTKMAVSGTALMLGSVVSLMPVAQTIVAELTGLQVAQVIFTAFAFGGGLALAISAAAVEDLENKLLRYAKA